MLPPCLHIFQVRQDKAPDESVKNAPLTDYSYDATGRKRSLIGEGTYSKNWKQMALSVEEIVEKALEALK